MGPHTLALRIEKYEEVEFLGKLVHAVLAHQTIIVCDFGAETPNIMINFPERGKG